MKFSSALFSLLTLLAISKISHGQFIPQTSIPFSEVQMALGVEKGEDFALVYKGDTLAAQISDSTGSSQQLFDEEILYHKHEDSISYEYSLPYSFGSYRISIPDSTLLYLKETRFYNDTIEREVRYGANGAEKFRLDRNGNSKTVTITSDNFKTITTITENGWSRKYQQFQPDSSYYASYSLDSVLLRSSYSNDRINGEKIKASANELSSTSDLSRDYKDEDSSYHYSYYTMSDGGSRLTEEFRKEYPDFNYECKEWSYYQDFGFERRYTRTRWDSVYGYQSFGAGSFFTSYESDSIKVSKSFSLNGDLIYRQRIDKVKGRFSREEEMSKEDTFYHFINYYHALYWENDTDYITSYYPFANRVFLNEDSVKIKEYKYDFDKKYEWPEVIIIEGDSTVKFTATSKGRFEYGSPLVLICGERGPPRVHTLQTIDYSSVQFTGALKKRSQDKVMSFVEDCKFIDFGIGWPPVYFLHTEGNRVLSSMQPHTAECKESLATVFSEKDDIGAVLYYKGDTRKVECTLFRLDYTFKIEKKVFR